MSREATNGTLEGSAPRRSLLKAGTEDDRLLSDSRENELLPAASTAAPLPYRHRARAAVTLPSQQQQDWSESGESGPVDLEGYALAEMLATPPFMPTERQHDFFMRDADSQSGGDGDVHMKVGLGPDSLQAPSVNLDIVVTDAQGMREVSATALSPASSVALSAADASFQREQPVTHGKTSEHGGRRRRCCFSFVAKAPPFDPAREQQWNVLTRGPDSTLPLYRFDEIPHWQKYNPYIRGRYRAFYSLEMCVKSLFGWHNESVNVCSHLLTFVAFLVFTVLLYTTVLSKAVSAPSLGSAKLIYGIFCFGSLLCMLNSSLYHLFNGHCSCRVMTAMGRLDFIGITVLIVSSFLPPLYVMFHCNPVARVVYITSILVLGTAGIVGPWTDLFHEHMWVRLGVFLGLGFSGLVPAIHSLTIVPLNAATMSIIIGILLMVALYCSGVAFYVTQFPESRYPGHFDCWLSSHQLWHFFVSMAALAHYFNCVSMYQMWQVSDGMCQ
ncbi:hypothetical protein LSCM1_00584 [Leishmania martiniquensis]|uniref:Adiponectin receptor protein 1 n=1 Tax=Leishmania martiniquensis TaxID=1580590 RepID=A0A836GFR5_9TRYP|nr:hypothetical protein LSCM1_00584 [Leishmania martiniquensis]